MIKYKSTINIMIAFISLFIQYGMAKESNEEYNEKWIVALSIFSGRTNPSYLLNEEQIDIVKKEIYNATALSDEVASEDKNKHKGISLQYSDYGANAKYYGISISVEDQDSNLKHYYKVCGKYIRIYSDDGDSSRLYRMKNNKLEKYLLDCGVKEGKINKDVENKIKSIISKQ